MMGPHCTVGPAVRRTLSDLPTDRARGSLQNTGDLSNPYALRQLTADLLTLLQTYSFVYAQPTPPLTVLSNYQSVALDYRNHLLYVPSFFESVSETWQWHGIFLGMISIAGMLFGISQRNKLLTFGGLFVVLVNGYVQSRQFFNSVPRWIYLGLGGTGLVTLGGFSEFKRETFVRLRKQFDGTLEGWD